MLTGGIAAGYLGYKFPFLLGAVISTVGLALSFFIKENVRPQKKQPKIKELLSVITGFGSGISMTILLSLCSSSINEEHRSSAMGFFQAIYGIGMFIGPVIIGFFADSLGIIWGFMFSAIVALAGAAGSYMFIENQGSF